MGELHDLRKAEIIEILLAVPLDTLICAGIASRMKNRCTPERIRQVLVQIRQESARSRFEGEVVKENINKRKGDEHV